MSFQKRLFHELLLRANIEFVNYKRSACKIMHSANVYSIIRFNHCDMALVETFCQILYKYFT